MNVGISLCSLGLAALLFVGCGKDGTSTSVAKSDVLVEAEPQGAVGVGEARKTAKDGGEIVLVGRIGGSEKPFVSGMAAFTIVDPKIAPCGAEEGCPTPWDYCCDPNLVKQNIATIKVNDASGRPVMIGANDLLGVKELATVVVKGTAKTGADGGLSVTANQIFVRK